MTSIEKLKKMCSELIALPHLTTKQKIDLCVMTSELYTAELLKKSAKWELFPDRTLQKKIGDQS